MDGDLYQNKLNENAVTLVWHIDGAPTVKAKKIEIWLITAFIVELGVRRYCLKNLISCGLWYGSSKPDYELFQIAFTSQISRLMKYGFTAEIEGLQMQFFVNIQAQLADLPAKAASLKMKQFNGLHGCTICYHPGELIDPKNRTVRGWVYPFRENVVKRTFEEVWKHAHDAEETGTEQFGVKGKSVVLDIQKVPEEAPLDYMHLALIGKMIDFLTLVIFQYSTVFPHKILYQYQLYMFTMLYFYMYEFNILRFHLEHSTQMKKYCHDIISIIFKNTLLP